MSRKLPTEHETWSRTLVFLLLGFICYALPWSVFAATERPAADIHPPGVVATSRDC